MQECTAGILRNLFDRYRTIIKRVLALHDQFNKRLERYQRTITQMKSRIDFIEDCPLLALHNNKMNASKRATISKYSSENYSLYGT